jgi:hypothetical protein
MPIVIPGAGTSISYMESGAFVVCPDVQKISFGSVTTPDIDISTLGSLWALHTPSACREGGDISFVVELTFTKYGYLWSTQGTPPFMWQLQWVNGDSWTYPAYVGDITIAEINKDNIVTAELKTKISGAIVYA